MAEPFVSCIMPTYNRRAFLPHAIRYFLRQDYRHKELIIIDDGSDCVKDLVPSGSSIQYYRLDKKITLGAKLNLACGYSRGSIIVNWDDDDWYAPHRLSYQVEAMQTEHTYICGLNTLLYYDLQRKNAFKYVYPHNQRPWLLGSSLCYRRDFWNDNRFADINVGMDGLFVWRTSADHVKVLPDPTFSVHMIHDSNVSPKKTEGEWWHRYPVEEIVKIMNSDYSFYNNGKIAHEKMVAVQKVNDVVVRNSLRPVRNVFACLVHEHEDCVIDLVRNLHYRDPSSIILLYNGGEDSNLISPDFPYHNFGVVVYPKPEVVKWGYLHNFALQCMAYALANFSFDTFTAVDSDQLCMRHGYSDYLGEYLSRNPGAGMLSAMPMRIGPGDKSYAIAAQAFNEYDLWRPLLQQFPKGEDKFVHWTFWPATVFTSDAARDLVKIFRENKTLTEIMQRTKIWATEEVILPTLVRLLGYEIVRAPFSYDFVKFKKQFTVQDADTALNRPDVCWMHPIERKYENSLRKHIRQRSVHYCPGIRKGAMTEKNSPPMLLISSLISRVRKIEGWLSELETDLLIATALKACIDFPAPQHIVEIGSYHGKSTVALGNIAKALFPGAKVFAVDPHNGVVGASDQGLQKLAPSLQMFRKNIEAEGLTGTVELIKEFSFDVKWDRPVHMIFIDGLHDYPNVSKDFWHFSQWIVPKGYVAFHDYADYYPGVVAFVNELLDSDAYQKVQVADSLMVLQKMNV